MLNDFILWRKRILLLSQLAGATLCIYFIINVSNYAISWKLLNTLMPLSIISKLNNSFRVII
jgi:hypothetical protein